MRVSGDGRGPIFEGWTPLSALAAQTGRLRLGLLVTSNRIRPPAVLAKIATTVDVVSGGRLEFGVGAAPERRYPRSAASTTPTACRTSTSVTLWGPSPKRAP
jgi:alkanesulfonate monooxygenase SsuD/methylene tetrahydromethanopterin reductase-like flavin-dependent oxidoreductase (luciferase family)